MSRFKSRYEPPQKMYSRGDAVILNDGREAVVKVFSIMERAIYYFAAPVDGSAWVLSDQLDLTRKAAEPAFAKRSSRR